MIYNVRIRAIQTIFMQRFVTLNGNLATDYLYLERLFTDSVTGTWIQLNLPEANTHKGNNITLSNNTVKFLKTGLYILFANIDIRTSVLSNEVGIRILYNNTLVIAKGNYDLTTTEKSIAVCSPIWVNVNDTIAIQVYHSKTINYNSTLRVRIARIPTV